MTRRFSLILVFFLSIGLVFRALAGADENDKPVFRSPLVNISTPGHAVKIEAEIRGATDLYLVATDAGDGFNFDHCDWVEPRLVDAKGSTPLTDLKWQDARCGYGTVNKNRNCTGGSLRINDKDFANGIGTHANSIIHFELPKNHGYTKFTAIGGIDNSGSDQGGGDRASVRFLVFTKKPPQKYWTGNRTGGNEADHDSDKVLTQFDIHPDLKVSLFAAEPMLVNPTNIDIDHLGRVWVCEVVNYRGKRNTRSEGDRILVLEDTNADGKADKRTVFYQGRDIDSAHGICVLGSRVIVSAGSEVFYLTDSDGDLKADSKEVLFTGIGGTQHDHGIHAFVFGTDGKLYFNFGNVGGQILDRDGKPIRDVAGQIVNDRSQPYRQGMVFRCNPDGSAFETLAWNFRNNWEVCVDSFGRMWQSDNDDDGNRGVRINFVMPFGNYGYLDEMTGAGWRTPRTGMASDIPSQHWHLNDPGVVPNLLPTGAGSPTGICFYEGDALPKAFQNQIIHCDAGPNIVRAYPIQEKGFGFTATTLNMMDGAKHNKWFRPSDVCVAPDGTLIVADWYDPGVGGHGMGDIAHGRLFRLTASDASTSYRVEKPDFTSIAGAIDAFKSPNLATRYLAWQALKAKGQAAVPALQKLLDENNDTVAARALWLLTKMKLSNQQLSDLIQNAFQSERPLIQETAVKSMLQLPDRTVSDMFSAPLVGQNSQGDRVRLPANVKRELLLGLSKRQSQPIRHTADTDAWMARALTQAGEDRWALEAIGIAMEGKWDGEHMERLLRATTDPATRNRIIWRSRSNRTPGMLLQAISDPATDAKQCLAYFRAFDFQPPNTTKAALLALAFDNEIPDPGKRLLVVREALSRLGEMKLDESQQKTVFTFLAEFETSTAQKIQIVRQFRLQSLYPDLIEIAKLPESNDGSKAMSVLLDLGQSRSVAAALRDKIEEDAFLNLVTSVSNVPKRESVELLADFANERQQLLERRKLAVRQMANLHGGCQTLISWAEDNSYDRVLQPAMVAALHSSRWNDIHLKAEKLFPLPKTRGSEVLPKVSQLVRKRGNIQNGLAVFKKEGTCATCHQVNGAGKGVGPDLSEIGNKLSKTAMYESILFPSAAISHNFEMWRVTTVDGEIIDGVIKTETEKSITLLDAKGNEHTIAAADVDEKEKQTVSLMPDDIHKMLSEQQLVDLIEYLLTLNKKQ